MTMPSTARVLDTPSDEAAKPRILVVDDEPSMRDMLRIVLRRDGYDGVVAENGREALGVLERGERIDLLVTDVILSGMDGPELARRAVGLVPELPVLFMSGYTDDEIVRRGLLQAGQPFLQKPFTPEALASEVAELLKARAARSEPVH